VYWKLSSRWWLTMHFLSASTVNMIQTAIGDNNIVLGLNNKGMYNQVTDLCECWNVVVDIYNGRDGPHSPENARERQTILFKTYVWFCRWKELHDERVRDNCATEYNFFAGETWFCIKTLLLGHVMAIHIYCVEQGENVRPQTMNTDTIEWFFGDARQMVGGSMNKMTARTFNWADKQASTFNAANFALVAIIQLGTTSLVEKNDTSTYCYSSILSSSSLSAISKTQSLANSQISLYSGVNHAQTHRRCSQLLHNRQLGILLFLLPNFLLVSVFGFHYYT
jgi:hypothetical protein